MDQILPPGVVPDSATSSTEINEKQFSLSKGSRIWCFMMWSFFLPLRVTIYDFLWHFCSYTWTPDLISTCFTLTPSRWLLFHWHSHVNFLAVLSPVVIIPSEAAALQQKIIILQQLWFFFFLFHRQVSVWLPLIWLLVAPEIHNSKGTITLSSVFHFYLPPKHWLIKISIYPVQRMPACFPLLYTFPVHCFCLNVGTHMTSDH